MIQCGGGDFVSSFPFEENFAHHVIYTYLVLQTTVSETVVTLHPAYRDVIRGYEPRAKLPCKRTYGPNFTVHFGTHAGEATEENRLVARGL